MPKINYTVRNGENEDNMNTEYTKIYDHFYGNHAKAARYNPSDDEKIKAISYIFNAVNNWREQQAVRACVRYNAFGVGGYTSAVKNTGISKKELVKYYEQGKRHMYAPLMIAIAVPGFYYPNHNKNENPDEYWEKITLEDMGNNPRYLRALNRQGIYYKNQIKIHLTANSEWTSWNGKYNWYFLWTIPGIGDGGKQTILRFLEELHQN